MIPKSNFETHVGDALYPWARHFTLTCSTRPRCINGYRPRLGRSQACCAESWRPSHSNMIHWEVLAQSLVKRRCAPLDALKNVSTNLPFTCFPGMLFGKWVFFVVVVVFVCLFFVLFCFVLFCFCFCFVFVFVLFCFLLLILFCFCFLFCFVLFCFVLFVCLFVCLFFFFA